MSNFLPSIEEIYRCYHAETMHAMKGFYPRSIKNFDSLVSDSDKELLLKFQNFLKRNGQIIDWKIYIKALAIYFKRRFELKILGSLAGNKIYRQFVSFNNLNVDKTEEQIHDEIINSLKFLKDYLKFNELKFDEYFQLDLNTTPTCIKHLYSGSISEYFYACFDFSKICKLFFNIPDDIFQEFFRMSKNDFIEYNLMKKRDIILKYKSIKTIIDKFQEKF